MLIIKSIILNYDGIMIKPEFSSQKNVIILCDSWYTKQNLVSIVDEYPNLDLIGNARADDDFTLSDEKINGYYIGVRRVLTNLFGSREVFAYVTTYEKDSGTRRLFFCTIFSEQLQIFCAWLGKAPLNQTGSEWFQYILLFLYSCRWNIEISYYEQKTFWPLCSYMVRSCKEIRSQVFFATFVEKVET